MILITGPTGSGKSTSLAALVDHINETRKGHIITLEDPIEFVHDYKQCVITQREIGVHVPSFAEGVRSAQREHPHAILVGEMRDPETIGLAVTAAETGIQVLGTLHTSGAARTINRILNVFPSGRREQVRAMLADSLRMVVSQVLLRTPDRQGRVAATEVLMNTHAVASMIRTGNSHKLESVLQTGSAAGMQSMDACLRRLVEEGWIDGEEAYNHATDKGLFTRFVARQDAA
jgi:twitching motility protein PilT